MPIATGLEFALAGKAMMYSDSVIQVSALPSRNRRGIQLAFTVFDDDKVIVSSTISFELEEFQELMSEGTLAVGTAIDAIMQNEDHARTELERGYKLFNKQNILLQQLQGELHAEERRKIIDDFLNDNEE